MLVLADKPVTLELIVPTQPVGFESIPPILEGLTDFIVDRGVVAAEAEGRTISCHAGCGACCRQLVPVSQAEARALAAMVDAMPELRRSEIHRRFEDALQSLHAAGVVAEIDAAREHTVDTFAKLGIRYFHQDVACPFLEEESCSIPTGR